MKSIINSNRKLLIFFFYDEDGVVDQYIKYFLDDLSKHFEEIIIVCNGKLNISGREIFTKYTNNVITRENEGFDVWAYKTGFDYFGWNTLEQYDEIVLTNFTLMGPIYPFCEMFKEMDKRNLDFWGINIFQRLEHDFTGCNPYGFIPLHIQSHFMTFRKSLVCNEFFQRYWNELPPINSYLESIGKHETYFTKYFEDLGFKWGVYVDTSDMETFTENPIIMCPRLLIEERSCPVFKRRSFFHSFEMLANFSSGAVSRELFNFLRDHTNYDVDLIFQNILRTMYQSDFYRVLQLDYILAHKKNIGADEDYSSIKDENIALFFFISNVGNIKKSIKYIASWPVNGNLFVLTSQKENIQFINNELKILGRTDAEIILTISGQSPIEALLRLAGPCSLSYTIACFSTDYLDERFYPITIGEGVFYGCLENTLKSKTYIDNIIRTFMENPRLGMLSPPSPIHGIYFRNLMSHGWGKQNSLYDHTVSILRELDMKVPIAPDKEPIAPYGGAFWFRPKALISVFSHKWSTEAFEYGDNISKRVDAIEYVYPFAVQAAGYYPAYVMNTDYAALRLGIQIQYLREFGNTVGTLLYNAEFMSVNRELKIRLQQAFLPFSILLADKAKQWVVNNFLLKVVRIIMRIKYFLRGKNNKNL